ncbi:hypothetical protein FRB90_011495 [Tulasnella sp. 427]|nr:hypothetical protein FRB90_011495 [Tulasnella sp. 427]
MSSEADPLLPTAARNNTHDVEDRELDESLPRYKSWQHHTGEALESKRVHRFIIFLILIDSLCVITDLAYVFLTPQCGRNEDELPDWLEVLARISLTITTIFLAEIPVAIWAFGVEYYNPFCKVYPHSGFHLFDAVVIIGSFIVEVFLKGRDRELASLIIVFRLWRIVKVVGGVAVGVSEYNEEAVKELKRSQAEVNRLRTRVQELEDEVASLKHQRVGASQ